MRETAEDDGETQPSKGIRGCPRDLLRQLSGDIRPEEPREAASGGVEDSGEIEVSLGLSLGGSFGADPCRRNGLRRSSSIAFVPFLQQGGHEPGAATLLTRTCSLPVEPKEGERKRKELQCLRRMEAKRRRAENLDGTPLCGGDQADSGWVRNFRSSEFERLRGCPRLTHFGAGAGAAPPNGAAAEAFPFWVAGDGERRVAAGTRFAPASQGSVGSQGSSSSGSSDFDSRRPKQEEVGNGTTDPRGSSVVQSLADPGDEKAAAAAVRKPTNCARPAVEGDSPPSEEGGAAGCDGMRGIMEDMPCVSARGDGPNGRRVEGFLYRYGKGEEVRIVCVCHGRFLSPAEFVKHAGGGDVAHPLRHIIVNPARSSFS